MPRRTPAPPGHICWCSDRASVSPTPFRSAARRGETFRSCLTALPGRRLSARAGGQSVPSGPSPPRSPALCPPVGPSIPLLLAAFPDSFPDFFLHQQFHHSKAGLANQCSHALVQPADHLGHRQHHLHRRISIRGHFLELSHSSLRFNLIWFLHSDSPFSRERKFALSLSRLRAESRYFLRSTGHSLFGCIGEVISQG